MLGPLGHAPRSRDAHFFTSHHLQNQIRMSLSPRHDMTGSLTCFCCLDTMFDPSGFNFCLMIWNGRQSDDKAAPQKLSKEGEVQVCGCFQPRVIVCVRTLMTSCDATRGCVTLRMAYAGLGRQVGKDSQKGCSDAERETCQVASEKVEGDVPGKGTRIDHSSRCLILNVTSITQDTQCSFVTPKPS